MSWDAKDADEKFKDLSARGIILGRTDRLLLSYSRHSRFPPQFYTQCNS
ncbi:MAG: hypothetical protein LW832_07225 [Parachlamydia sp.]|nr:hypothetical protein [Parachlamydia sp.]